MGRSIAALRKSGSPRGIACIDYICDVAWASRSGLGSGTWLQRAAEHVHPGRDGRQSWQRGALRHAVWRPDVDAVSRIGGRTAARISGSRGARLAHCFRCRCSRLIGRSPGGHPACPGIRTGSHTAAVGIEPARAVLSAGKVLAVLGAGCDLLHLWRVDIRLDRWPDRYPLHERGP